VSANVFNISFFLTQTQSYNVPPQL